MNEPEKILRHLSPPAGGWQRLLARREAPPRWARQWLPLAAGSAVTLLLLTILAPQPKLEVSWPRAPSLEAGLQPLDAQQVRPLPSEDPHVRIYWMDAAPATRRD